MPSSEKLCFVQFLHPGGEHTPDRNSAKKGWNTGDHRRKFVQVPGSYREKGRTVDDVLGLWAEWEPESEVITQIANPSPHGPHFVWRPFYSEPASYKGLQNTDPFVFDGFYYTGCQQNTKLGPTQMRYLSRGSVILFGSYLANQFVLDTLFVVKDWTDHTRASFAERLQDKVPEAHWSVTLGPWYEDHPAGCAPGTSFRLYRGATVETPVEGMFSFFPCLPANACPEGFARPVVDLPDLITPTLRQGKRLNRDISSAQIRSAWSRVVSMVEGAGLSLGTYAAVPERRPLS